MLAITPARNKKTKEKMVMAKNESKKTANTENMAVARTSGVSSIYQLDSVAYSEVLKTAQRRNLPPMVKPVDVPIESVICAEIVRVVDSPVSTVKGKLLWLRAESGQEFTFPCTGVIRSALAPGLSGDDLQTKLDKEIGKVLILKRLEDKMSDKFKKAMFMFDVFTVDKK